MHEAAMQRMIEDIVDDIAGREHDGNAGPRTSAPPELAAQIDVLFRDDDAASRQIMRQIWDGLQADVPQKR